MAKFRAHEQTVFYAKDFLTKEEMSSEDVPETDNSKEQSQKEIDFAEEEQNNDPW